jgi:hypothetical protein
MRIKDTLGRLKTDPEEARLMINIKPGETGEWTSLGQEGIDNDDDGQINEDSEGLVDGNRNWGFNWNPPYAQNGAGNYPFEGTGIKAIADWMMARPNIIMVFAFHNSGGMYLRGPSFKSAGELSMVISRYIITLVRILRRLFPDTSTSSAGKIYTLHMATSLILPIT